MNAPIATAARPSAAAWSGLPPLRRAARHSSTAAPALRGCSVAAQPRNARGRRRRRGGPSRSGAALRAKRGKTAAGPRRRLAESVNVRGLARLPRRALLWLVVLALGAAACLASARAPPAVNALGAALLSAAELAPAAGREEQPASSSSSSSSSWSSSRRPARNEQRAVWCKAEPRRTGLLLSSSGRGVVTDKSGRPFLR